MLLGLVLMYVTSRIDYHALLEHVRFSMFCLDRHLGGGCFLPAVRSSVPGAGSRFRADSHFRCRNSLNW